MEPNLARIPGEGDTDAEVALELLGGRVTVDLLAMLEKRDLIALGQYGAHQVTLALRERSAERLRRALLATAICDAGLNGDDRDMMVGLALYFYVAEQLGQPPAELFGDIAARLPRGWVP